MTKVDSKSNSDVVSLFDPKSFKIEWRNIPGFSKYQASQLGTIRRKRKSRIPKFYNKPTSIGSYIGVSALSDNGKHRAKEVHHLVCLAFNGLPPDDGQIWDVNHLNGIKHDNRPGNLEWQTKSGNLIHAYKTGLRKDNTPVIVTDHVESKVLHFYSIRECARSFNLKPWVMSTIINAHHEIKYDNRYTFCLDMSNRVVANHKWTKDIIAFDYVTNEAHYFSDIAQAANILKVKRASITFNLSSSKSKLLAGYHFRYAEDKSPFPKYTYTESKKSRLVYMEKTYARSQVQPMSVVCKNYVTDEVVEYPTRAAASKATGLISDTILRYVSTNKFKLIKGYVFKSIDDGREWPIYPKGIIDISLKVKKPEYPILKVTDMTTDTIEYFVSNESFAEHIGGCAIHLGKYIRANRAELYLSKFRIEKILL